MSENIEIDQLTKTLSHIVHKLTDLINNKGNAFGEQEPLRIKKTPDMTYHDFLQRALASRQPVDVTTKKQSYRLQEDLELLLELSSYGTITSKSFD